MMETVEEADFRLLDPTTPFGKANLAADAQDEGVDQLPWRGRPWHWVHVSVGQNKMAARKSLESRHPVFVRPKLDGNGAQLVCYVAKALDRDKPYLAQRIRVSQRPLSSFAVQMRNAMADAACARDSRATEAPSRPRRQRPRCLSLTRTRPTSDRPRQSSEGTRPTRKSLSSRTSGWRRASSGACAPLSFEQGTSHPRPDVRTQLQLLTRSLARGTQGQERLLHGGGRASAALPGRGDCRPGEGHRPSCEHPEDEEERQQDLRVPLR